MDLAIDPELTPWEQRGRLGVARGFWETLRRAAFSPSSFFSGLRDETPWTEAFWYGWLLQALLGVVGTLLYLVPILSLHGGALPGPSQLGLYLVVPLAPVVLYPVIVLALAAVAHLLARLTHGAHRGLGATLRAVCYSGAALGLVVSLSLLGLWGVVIGAYALARFQQTTVSRAAVVLVGAEVLLGAAVLVPLALQVARNLP